MRRSREDELRASEARLKVLLGCTQGIAFEFDTDGHYLHAWTDNEALLALPRSELIGRTVPDVVGDAFGLPFVERLRRVGETGQAESFEYSLDVLGGQRWFVADLFREPLVEGERARIAALIRDITESKRMVEALLESEERFRTVVEGSPDPIGVAVQGRVRYANPAFVAYLGYDRVEELLGRQVTELVVPEEREIIASNMDRLLAGEPIPNPVYRYLGRDGKVRIAEVSRHRIQYDGEPAGLAILRDQTETRSLQAQVMAADRMASIGAMAAGLAHEINNPLAYVVANLGFAIDALEARGETTEVLEALRGAREGVERVSNVVREIKMFTRAEDARSEDVDVEQVLRSAIKMGEHEIRHAANLSVSCDAVPPVHGNGARLGQVFLNLLLNAAQAFGEGRHKDNAVRVRLRSDEAGDVVVEISDTGVGIAAEDMAHIFDAFFSTKPIGMGTGLGLSICRDIVAAHRGQLEVESTPGRGSTFRVVLPASTTRPPSKRVPSEPVAGRRGRVLVVDDDRAVAHGIRRTLAREHDVTVVTDSQEALARLLLGERYDVILCDVMMPGMDGIELYAELARESAELAARVVFVTGGAVTVRTREFRAESGLPFVDKPFDPAALRRLVRERVGA